MSDRNSKNIGMAEDDFQKLSDIKRSENVFRNKGVLDYNPVSDLLYISEYWKISSQMKKPDVADMVLQRNIMVTMTLLKFFGNVERRLRELNTLMVY